MFKLYSKIKYIYIFPLTAGDNCKGPESPGPLCHYNNIHFKEAPMKNSGVHNNIWGHSFWAFLKAVFACQSYME